MKNASIHEIINAKAGQLKRGLTYSECMPLIMLKYRNDSTLTTKTYKRA